MSSPLISAAELQTASTEGPLLVLDCRADLLDPAAGRRAWEQGHIPGSVHLDLARDLSAPVQSGHGGRHPLPDRQRLAALLADLGAGPDSLLVACDDSGGSYAARLWWLARWLGHSRVQVLDGGLPAWRAMGGAWSQAPAATGRNPAVRLQAKPALNRQLDAGDLHRAALLLDARAAARFRGEVEPIDPVAGHIPGARNQPFQDSLGPDGHFLAAQQLQQLLLTNHPDAATAEPVVVYCGSGVTACHLALAFVHAGLPEPALYPGSWSHWLTDPKRPVATGP